MKRLLPLLALALAACQAPALPPAPAADAVVGYLPGADRAALRARFGVTAPIAVTPDAELWRGCDPAAVAGQPGVEYAEPNRARRLIAPVGPAVPVPAFALAQAAGDPLLQRQWHLARARFPQAWEVVTGVGVTVAVIDSGVDPEHPDLKAHLDPLIDEITAFGKHDVMDGERYDGRDSNGHGTHVCGLVGAIRGNGIGVVGGAPDARILPIKVTDWRGETDDATIARGITDAVARGARVLNLSIGGPEPSQVLLAAMNQAFRAGATVVIAAGNFGGLVYYPAAYPGVVSVGAITQSGAIAAYSAGGDDLVLVAPGGGGDGGLEGAAILSTVPTYASAVSKGGKPTSYAELSGTSMAAPLVSALAALVVSQSPALTGPQVRTRLAATAADLGEPGWDGTFGWGQIDAEAAVGP